MRRQSSGCLELITQTNDFAVTEDVPTKSALTLYALRVWTIGLSDAAFQEVYRSLVVARLLYAASALHGVTKTSDRRRIP